MFNFLRNHSSANVQPQLTSLALFCSASSSKNITISERKPRNPTDILKALSSTVKKDYTAAHYKFHDDPFLIPLSNTNKRTFALAQEAGKKAAKWIINKHSDLFQHQVAEPPIEVFTPKVYNKKSIVGEDTILNVIEQGQVGDAIIVYGLLKKRDIEISDTAKQALLELLCFYNSEEQVSEDYTEERWFSQSKSKTKQLDYQPKLWKQNEVIDELFTSLPKSSQLYSTMISGMIKYGEIVKAWELYEKSKEEQFILHITAFNALLSSVNSVRQGADLRWDLNQELLATIAKHNIKPNIDTLNIILQNLSKIGVSKVEDRILDVIAEFKSLGVEPSLGSWSHVLTALCRDRRPPCLVLHDILDHVEGKSFSIQHASDTKFFLKAMEICHLHLHDIDLAKRVDQLLHTGDNYNLIGSQYDESVYYRHFFLLLCSSESVDAVMEMYNRLVPNVYTPEPTVMQEILKTLDLNGAVEEFPRIWSDMVLIDLGTRENLLTLLLEYLSKNEFPPGSPLIPAFASIADDICTKIDEQPYGRTNKTNWTGHMLSNVLLLFVRNEDIKKASFVMEKMLNIQSYTGEPRVESLYAYMDLCIRKNDFAKSLTCMKFCAENNYPETISMVKDVRTRLKLTDQEIVLLEGLGAASIE